MKKEFDSLGQQMTYINRFIHRNTDLELNCQYCGKPGKIRYYRTKPDKIHIVCKECSINKGLGLKKNWGKELEDIPLINIEDHITNPYTLNKMMTLNKDTKKILRDMLKSDKPKIETFKNTGISQTYLTKLINEYTNKVDKDYKNKLDKVFEENRLNKVKRVKLNSTINEESHPLAKLRLERNISNREIVALSKGRLTSSNLSAIQCGKSKPTLLTKIKIAEVLKVSVKEIFPEETEFGNVYKWNDYWFDIRNIVIKAINDYYKEALLKKQTKIMKNLSDITGIRIDRLYSLKLGLAMVTNDDYKRLKEHNIIREDI